MGRTAQLGQKFKGDPDVVAVAVSLDQDKAKFASFAPRLGGGWIVLCDFKGNDTRAAKDYPARGIPAYFVVDGSGKFRLGDGFSSRMAELIEDLKLEALWGKKRGPPSKP